MNSENLKQVRDAIASNPAQYDQGIYAHDCGTPACIAGWAAHLSLKPDEALRLSIIQGRTRPIDTIHNRAREWLDLPLSDANDMFEPAPVLRKEDARGYTKPTLPEALAMLDRAIETGKVVWKELPRVSEGEGV